jgi:hypothetical protein
MRDLIRTWLRWLLLAGCLAALTGADCVDRIRNVSEGLNNLADSIDGGEDEDDLNDFIDDLQDLFD